MLNLLNFVKNHFNTDKISNDRFKRFAQDHLSRLNANNTMGLYNQLIAQTTPLYDAFISSLQTEASGLALQQSRTRSVDNIIEEFKRAIRQKEGIIRGTFGVDSPEYQEFFPNGITLYTESTKSNIEIVMQQFIDALAFRQADLGNTLLQQFINLKDNYNTARQTQLQQMSRTDMLNTGRNSARAALEVQLSLNILEISKVCFGNSDLFLDFFDQSVLELSTSTNDGVIQDTVAPNETKNIESEGIEPQTKIKIKNVGTTELYFEVVQDMLTPASNYVTVQPNVSLTLEARDMGGILNRCLNVTNPNPAVLGKYEVLLL